MMITVIVRCLRNWERYVKLSDESHRLEQLVVLFIICDHHLASLVWFTRNVHETIQLLMVHEFDFLLVFLCSFNTVENQNCKNYKDNVPKFCFVIVLFTLTSTKGIHPFSPLIKTCNAWIVNTPKWWKNRKNNNSIDDIVCLYRFWPYVVNAKNKTSNVSNDYGPKNKKTNNIDSGIPMGGRTKIWNKMTCAYFSYRNLGWDEMFTGERNGWKRNRKKRGVNKDEWGFLQRSPFQW